MMKVGEWFRKLQLEGRAVPDKCGLGEWKQPVVVERAYLRLVAMCEARPPRISTTTIPMPACSRKKK